MGKKTASRSKATLAWRRPGARFGLIVGGCTAAAVAGLLVIGMQNSQAPVAKAEQRVTERARAVAVDAASSFEAVDRRLQRLVRLLEGKEKPAGDRAPDAGSMVQSAAASLPQLRNLLFVDGNGRIVAGLAPLGKGPKELRDAAFYAAHARRGDVGLYVGEPESAGRGSWSIPVSRRVSRSSGEFAGVVVALIDPLFLRPSFDELAARERLGSALVTPAGRIVVSSSSFAGAGADPVGQAAAIEPLVGAAGRAGAVRARLLPSGPEQLAAAVPVDGWPLVAVANVDPAIISAQSMGVFRGMVGAALAIVVAAVLIVIARFSVSHARRFARPA